MTQEKDTKNSITPHDEIDLRLVYHKIKQPFIVLWNFILNVYTIIQKRFILCVCVTLLGIVAGVGLFFVTKPVFSSTMTLSSSELRNDYCSDLIINLESIMKDNTPKLLAKKLKIDMQSAREIKKIEFSNYNEKLHKKLEDKDTIILGLPFKIKVEAFTNTIFDTLQTALVNYLENNPYALIRKEIKKQNLELMRAKLHTEIRSLDSLKFVVASNLIPRGNQSGFVFGQPLDPINVYKEGISLFQDDLNLNSALLLIDNIQVINGFSPKEKPSFPKLWITTAIGGVAGLLLGLIIAFSLERRKKAEN